MGARRARAHRRSFVHSFIRHASCGSRRERVDEDARGRARARIGRESESDASAVKGGHRRDRAGGDGVGGGGARETRLTSL